MTSLPKRIFIDALPLSAARSSGVGHATRGLIEALIHHPDFQDYEIVLVTTTRGYRFLKLWDFPRVRYVKLPVLTRIMNRLPTTPFMPWMDLLLGRGVYIFTNFRSWPLRRSQSATYIHDVAFMIYPENLTKRHLGHLMRHVRPWADRSNKVVTVSESSKAEIVRLLGIEAKKIIVAYNGVELDELYPRTPMEITATLKKNKLPVDYLLFFGNIEPRKNLARLVRAYAKLPAPLRQKHPLLLVGGSGWRSEEIDAEIDQAKAAGNTIIRPDHYIDDTDRPVIISGAAGYVQPSVHEGFGMPPLEAMACGVPVAVSNIPAHIEVVGDAAIMFDPLDEADITAKLEQLLTDQPLRQKLVAAGLERVKQFTWDKGLAKLLTWIKSVSA